MEDLKEFLHAWPIAFVSVWVLMLTPLLYGIGTGIMYLANAGERYLEREQIKEKPCSKF